MFFVTFCSPCDRLLPASVSAKAYGIGWLMGCVNLGYVVILFTNVILCVCLCVIFFAC